MSGIVPIPYRIRLGVIGHRRLDDPGAIEALAKKAIETTVEGMIPEGVRQMLASTRRAEETGVSYSVMSSLAEGADRVVARAVLSYPDARLDAILPMTLEDCMEDFTTEASRKEFAGLLSQCSEPVLLRTKSIRDECRDAIGQAELRRDAYSRAGRYVVDHCDVLIAVWDGGPARGRGGTAETVQYCLHQNRPVLRVWGNSFEVLSRGDG